MREEWLRSAEKEQLKKEILDELRQGISISIETEAIKQLSDELDRLIRKEK